MYEKKNKKKKNNPKKTKEFSSCSLYCDITYKDKYINTRSTYAQLRRILTIEHVLSIYITDTYIIMYNIVFFFLILCCFFSPRFLVFTIYLCGCCIFLPLLLQFNFCFLNVFIMHAPIVNKIIFHRCL